MFSSVDPSLAARKIRQNLLVAGGFWYDFTGSQAAFCKHNRFKIAAVDSMKIITEI
jgi:hypothetical protein